MKRAGGVRREERAAWIEAISIFHSVVRLPRASGIRKPTLAGSNAPDRGPHLLRAGGSGSVARASADNDNNNSNTNN